MYTDPLHRRPATRLGHATKCTHLGLLESYDPTKEVWGLRFRDLKLFNLALLAQQAWRILVTPEALSSRILNAVYLQTPALFMLNWDHAHRKFGVQFWRAGTFSHKELFKGSAMGPQLTCGTRIGFEELLHATFGMPGSKSTCIG